MNKSQKKEKSHIFHISVILKHKMESEWKLYVLDISTEK